MDELKAYFSSKKNLINLLILLILTLALPLGIGLLRQQQILRIRAVGGPPITFVGPNVFQKSGKPVTSVNQVTLALSAPYPPAAATVTTSVSGQNQSVIPNFNLIKTAYAFHPQWFPNEPVGQRCWRCDNGDACPNNDPGWVLLDESACPESAGSSGVPTSCPGLPDCTIGFNNCIQANACSPTNCGTRSYLCNDIGSNSVNCCDAPAAPGGGICTEPREFNIPAACVSCNSAYFCCDSMPEVCKVFGSYPGQCEGDANACPGGGSGGGGGGGTICGQSGGDAYCNALVNGGFGDGRFTCDPNNVVQYTDGCYNTPGCDPVNGCGGGTPGGGGLQGCQLNPLICPSHKTCDWPNPNSDVNGCIGTICGQSGGNDFCNAQANGGFGDNRFSCNPYQETQYTDGCFDTPGCDPVNGCPGGGTGTGNVCEGYFQACWDQNNVEGTQWCEGGSIQADSGACGYDPSITTRCVLEPGSNVEGCKINNPPPPPSPGTPPGPPAPPGGTTPSVPPGAPAATPGQTPVVSAVTINPRSAANPYRAGEIVNIGLNFTGGHADTYITDSPTICNNLGVTGETPELLVLPGNTAHLSISGNYTFAAPNYSGPPKEYCVLVNAHSIPVELEPYDWDLAVKGDVGCAWNRQTYKSTGVTLPNGRLELTPTGSCTNGGPAKFWVGAISGGIPSPTPGCVSCGNPPAGCAWVGGNCSTCGTLTCNATPTPTPACVSCSTPQAGCSWVGRTCATCGTLTCNATPTPTPAGATPTPSPAAGATPTPTPAPGATPTPEPGATPTPTPTPAAGATPTPTPAAGATPTPTPAAQGLFTKNYKIAENPTDLELITAVRYTEPLRVPHKFTSDTPGQKTVWVEFEYSDGKKERFNESIELLAPDPLITSCKFSVNSADRAANTADLSFEIRGSNFGVEQGTIQSGQRNLAVRNWTQNTITAEWNKAPVGESLPYVLNRKDGQKAESFCSSVTQVYFSGKLFCPQVDRNKEFKARLLTREIAGNVGVGSTAAGAGTITTKGPLKTEQVVLKGGLLKDLTASLQEGSVYRLGLEVDRGLRKLFNIVDIKGTIDKKDLLLPLGDISPTSVGDGKINSFDKAELNRQWGSVNEHKNCDLNSDGVCNSFEWACMREFFGNEDEPEP